MYGKTRAVQKMTWADQTFVGNTYTGIDAVADAADFAYRRKTVDAESISTHCRSCRQLHLSANVRF